MSGIESTEELKTNLRQDLKRHGPTSQKRAHVVNGLAKDNSQRKTLNLRLKHNNTYLISLITLNNLTYPSGPEKVQGF